MTTTKLDDDDFEAPDEVAMTPAAIQTRAEMAYNWAASVAPLGGLPWSVRQHFGGDMPALLDGVERLRDQVLPAPTEVRTEFGAWCHGEDRNGIRLDQDKFASREQAARWGDEQIGRYGITGYRVMRREHHVFAEGARFATAITAWVEDKEEQR